MHTTFHFSSANELSTDFLDAIKATYKEKSIAITIEEDFYVPKWQQEEVLRRQKYAKEYPNSLVDFDLMMKQLEQELNSDS